MIFLSPFRGSWTLAQKGALVCLIALLLQVIIPPVHIYQEAMEETEQAVIHDCAHSTFGLTQGDAAPHHDHEACAICQSISFQSLVALILVALILLVEPLEVVFLRNTFSHRPHVHRVRLRSPRAPPLR